MIIARKPYCHDRTCGGDDCSRCHGPGACCAECGGDPDDTGCTDEHCTAGDPAVCAECKCVLEGDEDELCAACDALARGLAFERR